MKLIPPKIEDTPATCKEKIAKSTDPPKWYTELDKGGQTVHPVPAPKPTSSLIIIKSNATGTNQNLKLFKRGNAISATFIIKGKSQLPNPPTATGITKKKIIRKAWAVTIAL